MTYVTSQQFDVFQERVFSELKNLRTEMHDNFKDIRTDLNSFKSETHDNFQDVRADSRSLREDFSGLRQDFSQEKQKIDAVYESRNQVAVKFSRSFGIATIVLSILSSGVMFGVFLLMI